MGIIFSFILSGSPALNGLVFESDFEVGALYTYGYETTVFGKSENSIGEVQDQNFTRRSNVIYRIDSYSVETGILNFTVWDIVYFGEFDFWKPMHDFREGYTETINTSHVIRNINQIFSLFLPF